MVMAERTVPLRVTPASLTVKKDPVFAVGSVGRGHEGCLG